MYREDGKLAARGRHVKYLPMGRMWDLTATPLLFPFASKLVDRQHREWVKNPERTKVRKRLRMFMLLDRGLILNIIFRWVLTAAWSLQYRE